MKYFSEEMFLITRRAARYVSRKRRLLWIIGPRIDASWKFATRKSQSRIPVARKRWCVVCIWKYTSPRVWYI